MIADAYFSQNALVFCLLVIILAHLITILCCFLNKYTHDLPQMSKTKIKVTTVTEVRGDHNYDWDVFATEEGLELEATYSTIPWEDILNAWVQLTAPERDAVSCLRKIIEGAETK